MSSRVNFGDGIIKSSQAQASVEGYEVDGTGTASILKGSKQAILTDNGTGDYTLTFKKPYARAGIAVATSKTGSHICQIFSISKTAVRVKVFDAAGAAVDSDFCLLLLGFDYEQEY